jgi:proteic killer suppression protein
MIRSFSDKETEELFHGGVARRIPPEVRGRARRKLDMLNAAAVVDDLRAPPGNRLEELHGDRKGQHSIRINDQWRICFRFHAGSAFEVEIVDYH